MSFYGRYRTSSVATITPIQKGIKLSIRTYLRQPSWHVAYHQPESIIMRNTGSYTEIHLFIFIKKIKVATLQSSGALSAL